jgi:two-component system phosphate regulon response regulator OmpR
MPQLRTAPADDAPHLLLVDDDRRILELLSRYLSEQGFRVTTANNATEARTRLGGFSFDLLVLDVMMPGESGLELARAIRADSAVPILMLTARSEATDRINGLEIGADDYLGKPFEPRELLLRIGNILKRTEKPDTNTIEIAHFGDFAFHLDNGELTCAGKPVRITDREREMLRILSSRAGETVPRQALAAPGIGASERAVDVQINRLRRKIERDPTDPVHLRTVRGIGYRLVATP